MHKVTAMRALVFAEMKLPILHYARESLALMHFTPAPKTCVDKLSVTRGESGNGCGENQSSPLLSP